MEKAEKVSATKIYKNISSRSSLQFAFVTSFFVTSLSSHIFANTQETLLFDNLSPDT